MFASIATVLGITVDRYVYIVKPLKYPQIVTHRRMFLAVLRICITVCGLFTALYIHYRSFSVEIKSLCSLPESIAYFSFVFVGHFPLTLVFLTKFHILFVERKQCKRILAETMITSADNSRSTEGSANRMNSVVRFFVAFKAAKTFAFVVAVLTFCIFTPSVVGLILREVCTDACKQFCFIVLHYEFSGLNSIVNAFIYGMRDVKYKKAYLHKFVFIFFSNYFPFLKPTTESFIAALVYVYKQRA